MCCHPVALQASVSHLPIVASVAGGFVKANEQVYLSVSTNGARELTEV
jgi:hypothetical protein